MRPTLTSLILRSQRFEIDTPEGARQVVGFEVDGAAEFGRLLARHTQVPFEVHEGRKKKSE